MNSYERNPEARRLCVEHYGHKCAVCNFNFEEKYGKLGKNFIHVHHVKPLNSIRKAYAVDPIKDLIPVCPNCHAMLHRNKETLSITALKKILRSR
ncbi:HNH endonuclease [Leptospira sp. GIMC2001]|uniref:HNH endonuclease n=1 Tax=Leptospira sp. GIMC2001 TaxID=1513297 RepID=UPI003FA56E9D